MYKLVIFDMDGTLVDTDLMILETFVELYRLYRPDYKPSLNDIIYFSGPPIRKTLSNEFSLEDNDKMFKEYQRISRPLYDKYVKAYPHAKELVEQLKNNGVLVGIVTSKHHEPTNYSLSLIGFNNLFDYIVASDDVKEVKPNPEGIFKMMEHFNITNKKDVLYIGDNTIDYLTSKNASVDSMIVTWGPRHLDNSINPTYYLDSFERFYEVINHGKKKV
jgi:pyrophosphatase PpaX